MLQIKIPATEMFDERTQEFVTFKEHTLQLEHSLISLSKWESKWGKAFLSKHTKTFEETIDYIGNSQSFSRNRSSITVTAILYFTSISTFSGGLAKSLSISCSSTSAIFAIVSLDMP